MKNLLPIVLLILSAVLVSSLNCWMCPRGESSFEFCDDNKVKESCNINAGETRCGTFSYENKTGSRIFAKSCTTEVLCSKNNTFCANVPGEAKFCRVQCCEKELCNFQVGFATTTAPYTTVSIKTRQTTTTTPPPPPETTTKTTTTPTPPPTEKPLNPSKDPQSGEDVEDCSWVDGAASSVTNNLFTSGICLVFLAIFMSIL